MTGVLPAVLGVLLLGAVLFDLVWTTVAASGGAGPVTTRSTRWLWGLARRLRGTDRDHRWLRLAGIGIVIVGIVSWFLLIWLAWSLIFQGADDAVVTATGGRPASLVERVYFAGYTLTTLGNGAFTPGGVLWQVLTVVASFNGISVLTLGVTYLVPVISAVTGRRRIAMHVSSLGTSPSELVAASYQGDGWATLERHLAPLTPEFGRLGQQHLAYPVLHYFHDLERDAAIAVAVAVLDETLTLLEHGVREEARPDSVTITAARSTISAFLGALTAAHISPADQVPPAPSLSRLRAAGIPTVADGEFEAALEDLEGRRRVLRGFVQEDGWTWEAVRSEHPEHTEDEESPRDTMQRQPEDREDTAEAGQEPGARGGSDQVEGRQAGVP